MLDIKNNFKEQQNFMCKNRTNVTCNRCLPKPIFNIESVNVMCIEVGKMLPEKMLPGKMSPRLL